MEVIIESNITSTQFPVPETIQVSVRIIIPEIIQIRIEIGVLN